MTLWFLNEANHELPIYPIRQTQGRGNVQIQLNRIEEMQHKHGNFVVVIYDGRRHSWNIPFSWLNNNILPFAKVRKRPHNPSQRYLTVDQLAAGRHNFSFGQTLGGEPLHVDLGQFYNTLRDADDLTELLTREPPVSTELVPSEAPYIITGKELRALGLTIRSVISGRPHRFLANLHAGGFEWIVRDNALVVSHPDQSVDSSQTADIYNILLRVGRASTEHIRGQANWRPYQTAIRDAVMNTYRSRCAMCDVDHRSCLTASHIKPAAIDKTNRSNLANVLLLCSLHDALFDRYLITVCPNYRIRMNPNLETHSEHMKDWVTGLDGKKIRLPQIYPPDQDLLHWHAERTGVIC